VGTGIEEEATIGEVNDRPGGMAARSEGHGERPGVGSRTLVAGLARLPQGALSRLAGRLADLPIPRPLRRPVLGAVAGILGVDTGEAEFDIVRYRTVDELFTRRLRPGSRPITDDPATMV